MSEEEKVSKEVCRIIHDALDARLKRLEYMLYLVLTSVWGAILAEILKGHTQ